MRHIVLALAVASVVLLPFGARADTKMEIYGNADVSMDYVDRGMGSVAGNTSIGCTATGGDCVNASPYWQMSSNLSYLGVRMTHDLGDGGLKALVQFETQVDVAATPNVKDALGSRDSFIGLGGGFGAIKLGKSDTPYKKSTARMDPFSATVGDYNSIMGNTGGDNRAEFDLRLPHAAWWESAKLGSVNVALMVAPSQNRSTDNSGSPEGEFFSGGPGLCSGSAPHGSGAGGPPCNDGSFGDAYSASVWSDAGNLYWTVAYEIHSLVNRSGDNAFEGAKDETALKAGVQWRSDMTTVNFIYENMARTLGNEPSKYDERSRDGYYLSGIQKLSDSSQVEAAWGHANKTNGDPAGVTPNNQADMYALGYRKFLDKSFAVYGVYATQVNGEGAHYDLGASGHGIPIVGRDGSAGCDGADGCLAAKADGTIHAATLSAFSVGFKYTFSAPFDIGK